MTARGALLLLAGLGLSAAGCHKAPAADPPLKLPFSDSFDRPELGSMWRATNPDAFRIMNGALSAHGAHNQPLWLAGALPRDAVIDLDVWSNSPDGDIKVEVFGDGHSYDPDRGGYVSTGYVLIMGGWHNALSAIARMNEHGHDRKTRSLPRVVPGKRYHWRIVRRGGLLQWFVDDMTAPFLVYDDPAPLAGPGHDHLAIGNWESDAWYDNLEITAAGPAPPAP